MTHIISPSTLLKTVAMATLTLSLPLVMSAQASAIKSARPAAVLIELFTSEGCSDCPAADELLRQVTSHESADGQLIVGLSEHVSYWNGLGWRDPFSSELNTSRQSDYGTRFALNSVYTPQMIVNGRHQFVGSDRRALQAALAAESTHKQIHLHIDSVQITDKNVTFSYSAKDLPAKGSLQLVAVLVDDMDRSKVLRGENAGRDLIHVAVARALAPLGDLQEAEHHPVTLPLPPSFLTKSPTGHHLVLFAQQSGLGAVVGVDTKPL